MNGSKIREILYKISLRAPRTLSGYVAIFSSVIIFVIVSLIFFSVSNAYAHKVNIFAYAENGKIHAEGYFVDGSKCKNSLIEVFDEKSGKKILEGYTNENGQFSFKIPSITSIKIVLNASMGHKSEFTVTEDEIKEAMGGTDLKKGKAEANLNERSSKQKAIKDKIVQEKESEEKTKTKEQISSSKEYNGYDIEELEALIERVIDKKLQPVLKMLTSIAEKMERPGITEIVGGIGYIFGILGVILYFKSKNIIRSIQSKNKLEK